MAGARIAVRVEGLWKTYRIHPPGTRSRWLHRPSVDFHALRDVNLEVEEGTVLGVIGPNGAGKSTLLKILSRITDPTRGRVTVHGRVASLLEVGTGFHPELTGRENVYLNAAIHGMRRSDVTTRLSSIIEFARVGEFLDEPVKHYSSGMYLRLAFSIAAHLEPDILIVDEVLAVGDLQFQERCLQRVRDIGMAGRTVVLVSHDLRAVRGLCSRVTWIEQGEMRMSGLAPQIVRAYEGSHVSEHALWRPEPLPASVLQYTEVLVRDADGAGRSAIVQGGDPFDIQLTYHVRDPGVTGRILIRIVSSDGADVLWSASTDAMSSKLQVIAPGSYRTRCRVPGHLLAPGKYRLCVEEPLPDDKAQWHDNVLEFTVTRGTSLTARDGRRGVIMPLLPWATEQMKGAGPDPGVNESQTAGD
jgi:lipopolysaccharide transport system ATP-binding protein